jgi:hypothetical protein
MEQFINTNKKLVKAVKNIPTTADLQQWVFTLDDEEGTLFYSPMKIPDNAELHQITDEYALYTDANLNPLGVMVEYYNVNFIKHHDLFEKLSLKIFKGKEKVKVVDPKQVNGEKDTVQMFKALLERTLIKEADTKFIPA